MGGQRTEPVADRGVRFTIRRSVNDLQLGRDLGLGLDNCPSLDYNLAFLGLGTRVKIAFQDVS